MASSHSLSRAINIRRKNNDRVREKELVRQDLGFSALTIGNEWNKRSEQNPRQGMGEVRGLKSEATKTPGNQSAARKLQALTLIPKSASTSFFSFLGFPNLSPVEGCIQPKHRRKKLVSILHPERMGVEFSHTGENQGFSKSFFFLQAAAIPSTF